MTQRISLTRYLIEKQRGSQDAGGQGTIPPQLRLLLEVVARACKSISLAVRCWAQRRAKTCKAKSRKSWTSLPTKY